jgi:hypothetical protein
MSNTIAAAGLVDELDAFLDVVCGDPELVRAEFDDLVAACWDDSPPEPPTRQRRPPPIPRPRRRPEPPARSAIQATVPSSGWARQRGPPTGTG